VLSVHELVWQLIFALPPRFWLEVTWLGDFGLLLPAALLIGLWLLVSRRTRSTAWLWASLFGAASALVAASKLAFLGWGIGSARLDFTGISGHTMLAASVWPVALWLVAARAGHRWRVAAAVLGWLLSGVVGLSRLALYAHSASEVVSGLLLGMAASAAFLALQRRRPHPLPRASLVLLTLLVPLAVHPPGHAAPMQGLLERIAMRMAGVQRPFTREDLHRLDAQAARPVSRPDTAGAASRVPSIRMMRLQPVAGHHAPLERTC